MTITHERNGIKQLFYFSDRRGRWKLLEHSFGDFFYLRNSLLFHCGISQVILTQVLGVREKMILALPEYYRIGLAVGVISFMKE